jgi:hypothetical protein
MKKSEDNLIDRTLDVWQPRNAQPLSDEDARAILENVKGFFTLLFRMTIRFSDRLYAD